MINKEKSSIPLSIPSIEGNEWEYVKECLDTGWVSSTGKYVYLFEEKIASFIGVNHAIACINGTSALHISLMLAGVKPGEEVIVPTLTFIAPINAVSYCKAVPVFMDCDKYYNINVEKTIHFINEETSYKEGASYNRKTNRKISAIIPVHIFGNAVDLKPLIEICSERGIQLIEDAAEALGSHYSNEYMDGKYCGSIGKIGCLSFNGNKIITTGGGGMILTNDDIIAEKARYLTTQAKDESIYYVHEEIGYNYRLSNIHAAIGVAQLEQLPKFMEKKKNTYEYYKQRINGIEGLKIPDTPDYAHNNHWLVALQIDEKKFNKDRDGLLRNLMMKGIETRPVWKLNHLQRPYEKFQDYFIDNAHHLVASTLNLPCSVCISNEQIDEVIYSIINE